MRQRIAGLPALLATAALVTTSCQGGASGSEAAGAAPSPAPGATAEAGAAELREPNTLEGIYTEAQAQRGRQIYEEICSECHQTEEWQEDLFRARWNGESVYRFWTYIYERMPNGSPPYSLPRETVSDAVAYILQLNGVPAGPDEFGSDEESVAEHWLYWGELGG